MATREQIVKQAEAWLGRKESDGSFKEIIDTYNTYKPHPRGYNMDYKTAWCSAFVSAVAIKCSATDIIPVECSCEEQINLFKKLGAWQERDDYEANAGDIIYYDWQDNGKGDNTGRADHVGIVRKRTNKTFYVIEGNYNDAVKERKIAVNAQYIRGFGVPKYSADATPVKQDAPQAPQTAKLSVAEVAKRVIAGDYGNGAVRRSKLEKEGYNYDEVQAEVNKLTKAPASAPVSNTYTVKSGDTLWAIAQSKLGNGARYKEIMTLNGKVNTIIRVGEVLKLPKK